MAKYPKRTVAEIMELYRDLEILYRPWHTQQQEDDHLYTLEFQIQASEMPDQFEQVRPPSAKTIVDMVADHAAGSFPRLHVPRRKETAEAQTQATLLEKAGQGFWYRSMAKATVNPIRSWAQIGALRGAICASLLYNPDEMPDLPLRSDYPSDEEFKSAKDQATAERKSIWPFVLDWPDPMYVFPDPATEGREYVIHAFKRKAYEVKRAWPTWDWKVPGQDDPVKPTDMVDFVSYWDREYKSYIVAGTGVPQGKALVPASDGVQKHGYGFLPQLFVSAGYGLPVGPPQHKYMGLLTAARDLIELEARRMTHLDAIVAQYAFPWIIAQQQVNLSMVLGGATRVPSGMKVQDAVMELRPTVPIQEIVMELDLNRQALQRATLPDALGGQRAQGVYSGYHESLLIGTGRSKVRSLSDALERVTEWATTGFFKLVENKVKGPVSAWGKGMDDESAFVTIGPDDIKGHYEVYVSLVPTMPTDDATNIKNGSTLYQLGGIPMRDLLETYAGRENADELMKERLAEDVLKSPEMLQQLVADALKITQVTGGPIAVPGVRAVGEIGLGAAGAGGFGAPGPAPNIGPGTPPLPAPGTTQGGPTGVGPVGPTSPSGRPNTIPTPPGGGYRG